MKCWLSDCYEDDSDNDGRLLVRTESLTIRTRPITTSVVKKTISRLALPYETTD